MTAETATAGERFWEDHYAGHAVRTPKPNALLVAEVRELPVGTALDLGCGQGGDAMWLASRGWRVVAADVSATALQRGAGHAEAAGVAEGIEWQRHDLAVSLPAGRYDLVSACYLHSPVKLPRGQIMRSAAAAVNPGGTFVVVGHEGPASWQEAMPEVHLPRPQEVLDDLALPAGQWKVARTASVTRDLLDPDGKPATRPDNVLVVKRRAG